MFPGQELAFLGSARGGHCRGSASEQAEVRVAEAAWEQGAPITLSRLLISGYTGARLPISFSSLLVILA